MILHVIENLEKNVYRSKKEITEGPNIVNIVESSFYLMHFFTFVLHFRRVTQVIHPYYDWLSAVSTMIIIASNEYFNSDMVF